jgi:hypothetical protein
MTTTISDTEMTSDGTRHKAELVKLPSPLTGYSWQVTWLPGRHLTRDQAITAMTIAESVDAALDPCAAGRVWPHVEGWAAELGLSDVDAIAMASLAPEHY